MDDFIKNKYMLKSSFVQIWRKVNVIQKNLPSEIENISISQEEFFKYNHRIKFFLWWIIIHLIIIKSNRMINEFYVRTSRRFAYVWDSFPLMTWHNWKHCGKDVFVTANAMFLWQQTQSLISVVCNGPFTLDQFIGSGI